MGNPQRPEYRSCAAGVDLKAIVMLFVTPRQKDMETVPGMGCFVDGLNCGSIGAGEGQSEPYEAHGIRVRSGFPRKSSGLSCDA